MDADHNLRSQKSSIAKEAYCSPEFIYRLHKVAKCIPQLKNTGENFSTWENHLKVMIRNLTGSSDYLLHELHKHDPKLNQAVFNLIFWSIDEELQQGFNIEGSAGDAFQFLAGRFQSNSCIINRANFPEEILDNIVSMVYHQSSEEFHSIEERKSERVRHYPKKGMEFEVYLGHDGPPVLNSFQNLAVVNRKFHRLCLPKLWQHITFPSSVPAPMPLWTGDLLLKYANFVKSARFLLRNSDGHQDSHLLSEFERSLSDNTSSIDGHGFGYAIGVLNIVKIFKLCPSLEAVEVILPSDRKDFEWIPGPDLAVRLRSSFQLLSRLQYLNLRDHSLRPLSGDFVIDVIKELPSLASLELHSLKFLPKESVEESLGWNLAQLQKLHILYLEDINCQDQTWTANSWLEQFSVLGLECCEEITIDMANKFLNGRARFLSKLHIELHHLAKSPDMEIRFDLPALKTLRVLNDRRSSDLLASFENCKSIEVIEHWGHMYNDQWNFLKHLLSRRTWPKLLVLDIQYSNYDEKLADWPDVEELEETCKLFNITLLISKY